MKATVKKNGELKVIQSEDMAFYKARGWVETTESVAAPVKKGKKHSTEEVVEEPKEED